MIKVPFFPDYQGALLKMLSPGLTSCHQNHEYQQP